MQRVQGDAQAGNVLVTTTGVVSTTIVEGSFPSATVSVFNQGTLVLSSIFGDNGVTPKANPFTAASDGSWFFYAANGRYDIALSATGLSRTLGDILLDDPANNQAFGGNVTIAGTLSVTGTTTLANTNLGAANILGVSTIKQVSAVTALGITDNLGISHFFIAGTNPYTNTFVQGNGAGVVFLGSAAKASVADTTGSVTSDGSISLFTTTHTLAGLLQNDTAGGLTLTSNAGHVLQWSNAGTLFLGNAGDKGLLIGFFGATSGTITLQPAAVAGNTNLILPGTNTSDTLVAAAFAQTLTNKTLTSPTITGAAITTATITSPTINGTPTGTGIPTTTLKSGTGAGNYTSASTTYVRVDSTNLAYTVTIPAGWKLLVHASGAAFTATGAVVLSVALADGSADNTGILIETSIRAADASNADSFSLDWLIAGDGLSHTINMQYKTSVGADVVTIVNSGATFKPVMMFLLTPSN